MNSDIAAKPSKESGEVLKTNRIEKYVKILPIVTLLLIIASSTKLAVYYSVFNINIVDYLGVSEYIPLFIDDLHNLMVLLGFMILGALAGELLSLKQTNKTDNDNSSGSYRKSLFISLGTIVIITPIFLYFKRDSISEMFRVGLFPLLAFLFFCLLLLETFEKPKPLTALVCLIAFLFGPLIMVGYQEAYTILENKEKITYKVKINDDSSNSYLNTKFIGASKEYIYLYDIKELESIILPISKVEEIRVKGN